MIKKKTVMKPQVGLLLAEVKPWLMATPKDSINERYNCYMQILSCT